MNKLILVITLALLTGCNQVHNVKPIQVEKTPQAVLNAFVILNKNIQTSNYCLSNSSHDVYAEFDKQLDKDKAKTQGYYDRAQIVRQISQALQDTIASYKSQIIAMLGQSSDGQITHLEDTLSVIEMFEKDGTAYNRGKALEKMMQDAKDKLLDQVESGDKDHFHLHLDASASNKTFSHLPAAAAIAILSGYQSDVISSENILIAYLYNKSNKTDN